VLRSGACSVGAPAGGELRAAQPHVIPPSVQPVTLPFDSELLWQAGPWLLSDDVLACIEFPCRLQQGVLSMHNPFRCQYTRMYSSQNKIFECICFLDDELWAYTHKHS
jgi:hypothetical protein